MKTRLYDGDTFEHRGYSFRVRFEHDDCLGEPWKEHDGHGVISDWTTRDKEPGERVLATDRNHRRYYDVRETMKIARRDSWGCSHSTLVNGVFNSGHATKGEAIACAVDEDFERMRGWCVDAWQWIYAVVTLLDEDGDDTDVRESLGGLESDDDTYLSVAARELADEIVSRIEVEHPDAFPSNN